jgi:hypothetical protein
MAKAAEARYRTGSFSLRFIFRHAFLRIHSQDPNAGSAYLCIRAKNSADHTTTDLVQSGRLSKSSLQIHAYPVDHFYKMLLVKRALSSLDPACGGQGDPTSTATLNGG